MRLSSVLGATPSDAAAPSSPDTRPRAARSASSIVSRSSADPALLAETAPATAVVVDGLAFGHGSRNLPFPVGVPVSVDTTRGEVTWGGE